MAGKDISGIKKVRLVVCDMDGTLVDSQKRLTAKTISVIARAREQGVFVTLCSGRISTMMESYWRQAGIVGPVITANGAQIVDTATGNTLWEKRIEPIQALKLMDFCRERSMDYSALCDDGCYFSPVSRRRERFVTYNRIAGDNGDKAIPLVTLETAESNRIILDKAIYKLLVYQLRPGDTDAAREFIDNRTELHYTTSESGLLDISAPGVSKGNGLVQLARIMDIPMEKTCAFGDFENDLSMFREAGFAVAMANGSPEVKAAAHLVTLSNDQDGVAFALEKYIL